MKKRLAVALGLLGFAAVATAGVPITRMTASKAAVITAPNSPVLYDQMDGAAPGAGFISQDFDTANDRYDNQLADDFIVPAGQSWTISGVDVIGYFDADGLPPDSFNVSIFQSVPASTFEDQQTFDTGPSPFALVTADFNGDGIPDAATANALDSTVTVLINATAQGDDTPDFGSPTAFAVGALPFAVTAADLDGDGRQDIVSANVNGSSVSVLKNTTPSGAAVPTFADHQDLAAGSAPFSVIAVDVNGDGRLDLVVANRDAGTLSVLINTTASGDPAISFAAQQVFGAGSTPNTVASADINGDGKPDLVVANRDSNSASVLLNTTASGSPTASFSAAQSFAAGASPYSIVAPDINGDAKPDLVVANWDGGTVSVLLNTTPTGAVSSSFDVQQVFDAGASPFAISTADLNNDGRPDLLVANSGDGFASVLLDTTPVGSATVTFAPRQFFPTGAGAHGVSAPDVNGDGWLDLVVVNNFEDSISVLLSTSAADTAQPGAPVALLAAQSYTGGTESGDTSSITLADPINLSAGAYWLSVQARQDPTIATWYWGDRTLRASNLPFWQNPIDGFHSGCVSWTLKQDCGNPPDTAPAQLFRFSGSGAGIPPTVSKTFAPASVHVDAVSVLTLTLGNANVTTATLSADLVDAFPAGLVIAATPNAATSCGGTLTAAPGSATVTLSAGASIAAASVCTITVDVVATTAGSYVNTIASGGLQTDAGANTQAASATLVATGAGVNDPVISVTPNPLAFALVEGASATENLTIANVGGGVLNWQIAEAQAQASRLVATRLALASRRAMAVNAAESVAGNPDAGLLRTRATSIVLGDMSISQMADNTPGEQGISCGQAGVSTGDNSWWRRFTFSDYPAVGTTANVASVTISSATAGPAGLPLTINLYSIPHATTPNTIPTSALTLIGSGAGSIDSGLVTVTIPVSGVIADTAGKDLVVEWHTDGVAGGQFFPGANATPETHPTYLSAPTCGIAEPATAASLGFPNFHLVMVVNLAPPPASPCEDPAAVAWLSVTPTSGSLTGGMSSMSAVTVDATNLAAGTYSADVCVTSNDPFNPLVTVPVSVTVDAVIDPCSAADTVFCDGFDGAAKSVVESDKRGVNNPALAQTSAANPNRSRTSR